MKLFWSFILVLSVLFISVIGSNAYAQSSNQLQDSPGYLKIRSNTEGNEEDLEIPINSLLFSVTPHYNSNNILQSLSLSLSSDKTDLYNQLGYGSNHDTVFIYPSFTQAAYGSGGFYDYYHNKCDNHCLTVKIPSDVHGYQSSSIVGALILKKLGYSYVKDEDVDKNPDILQKYSRVIILHNEYVTKKEFNAITNHPNVIFLYPNALYAEVTTNYNDNTITLVKGHGYPQSNIGNGFNWNGDNSKYEYDVKCENWYFYKYSNSYFLNCYPEYKLLTAYELLTLLNQNDPSELLADISNHLRYPNDPVYAQDLLHDYDISGSKIPHWVDHTLISILNNDLSKSDLKPILDYLHDHKLLS